MDRDEPRLKQTDKASPVTPLSSVSTARDLERDWFDETEIDYLYYHIKQATTLSEAQSGPAGLHCRRFLRHVGPHMLTSAIHHSLGPETIRISTLGWADPRETCSARDNHLAERECRLSRLTGGLLAGAEAWKISSRDYETGSHLVFRYEKAG
jgi:hypothetical protein